MHVTIRKIAISSRKFVVDTITYKFATDFIVEKFAITKVDAIYI